MIDFKLASATAASAKSINNAENNDEQRIWKLAL